MKIGRSKRCSFALLLLSLSSCSGLVYYPDKYFYYPPQKFGLPYEEVPFKSKDGTQLYGWFFSPYDHTKKVKVQPKGTIIQFHGNAQNMSSHYLSLVWLVSQGYNFFTFSYRGYGKSEGEPDQEGTYLDGLAALQKAWDLNTESKGKLFVVYGESLGGAIAMRSFADFPHKDKTDLLVMDSTFLSYRNVAQRILSRHWMTWLFSPLAQILVSDEYAAEEALMNNQTRLLVIHDKKDPVVPFRCGEEIFEGAKSKKEMWTSERGVHVGTFQLSVPEARTRFKTYLSELANGPTETQTKSQNEAKKTGILNGNGLGI